MSLGGSGVSIVSEGSGVLGLNKSKNMREKQVFVETSSCLASSHDLLRSHELENTPEVIG